jgi:hypothetical protein
MAAGLAGGAQRRPAIFLNDSKERRQIMSVTLLDPAILGLIAGSICLVSFFLGRWSKGWSLRSSAKTLVKPEESANTDDQQAVSESEVVEALSSLGIRGETLKPVADKIQTVGQLKSTVQSLRWAAQKSAESEIFPLAKAYASRSRADAEQN